MSQPRRALARAAASLAALLSLGCATVGAGVVLAPAASARSSVSRQGDAAIPVAMRALLAIDRHDEAGYTAARHALASVVAPRAGLDGRSLDAAWARADRTHMTALLGALTQLGVPYHYNSSTPEVSFDCSGLTSWAWGRAGVGLPHQSGEQIRQVASRSLADVAPGDLLYYPGHVMLALGIGGAIVHAPNTGHVVEVRMLSLRQAGRLRVGDPSPAPRPWAWATVPPAARSAVDGSARVAQGGSATPSAPSNDLRANRNGRLLW
jgi:cell wall-associated NlpC family hydrolase